MTNSETTQSFANELLEYINGSPTPYHAVNNSVNKLKAHGFVELYENDRWSITEGGKYFITRNYSSLIAFEIGSNNIASEGFRVIGAHTDSPGFKVKPGSCTVTSDGYVKLNTEPYGGSILSTWFDRPLSIAGKVLIKGTSFTPKEQLIDLQKPILMIPNLCIHFQRNINDGYSYNKQTDVMPLLGVVKEGMKKEDYILNIICDELQVDKDSILDYELFLYEYDKGILTGMANEFISAPRLDDLSMVFAGLESLFSSESTKRTKVLAAFDNEEVGSTTSSGANSSYLLHTLKRICTCMNVDEEGYFMALANSIALSADTAHAVHPNFSDKHDPENRPMLGKGPVIKYSANQRYTTNAVSASYFIQMCNHAGVPYQKFVNRSDIVGGSTISPAMSSLTSMPTLDMGIPILAMHSIREFGCLVDNIYTAKAFQSFYSVS